MKDVVVAKGAEPFILESLGQLKYVMNDRSTDVRTTFYDVLFHWMTNMEIQSLRTVEYNFISFLLNGIADNDKDISEKCKAFLEEHGKRMKEALKLLGEEDGQEEEKDTKMDTNSEQIDWKKRDQFKILSFKEQYRGKLNSSYTVKNWLWLTRAGAQIDDS